MGLIPPYDVITHFSKKPCIFLCPIYKEDTISNFLKSDSRSCRETRDQQCVVPSHASESRFVIILCLHKTIYEDGYCVITVCSWRPALRDTHSTKLRYRSASACGPERSRTACLFIANEAFNQVNFGPVGSSYLSQVNVRYTKKPRSCGA